MKNREITKILIANRGEIAARIQRSCRKLSIPTVTTISEGDKKTLFARQADSTVVIGPPAPKESYLNIDRIINAALDTGCDAIHPGYGFLSENAAFAQAILKTGLVFIGPSPETISLLGDKVSARERVTANGVNCVPGTLGGLTDEALAEKAEEIGYPIIIKARAGGGGRGMRLVRERSEIFEAIKRARAEAEKFFSNPNLFIEKLIEGGRHVEVQILGDHHGKILHLGTRDCSTQRRHQKLIEEAPAPNLLPAIRSEIQNMAVKAARSADYVNAGTAEFLLSGEKFYFLEMNTRIQVEHPVTEMITGVDLIELQIRIARGEPIPFSQEEVSQKGHSIEYRIYSEDPKKGFVPSIGKLTKMDLPVGPEIRIDTGYDAEDEVLPFYDAMLCKVIVTAETRREAILKSEKALKDLKVEGVETTRDFHRWILLQEEFRRSPVDITFIGRVFSENSLLEVAASEIVDPKHCPPLGGVEKVEFYHYRSDRFQFDYTIEVIHTKDRTFVATPLDHSKRRGKRNFCRRSNGLKTVIQSLCRDVLEVHPPREILN